MAVTVDSNSAVILETLASSGTNKTAAHTISASATGTVFLVESSLEGGASDAGIAYTTMTEGGSGFTQATSARVHSGGGTAGYVDIYTQAPVGGTGAQTMSLTGTGGTNSLDEIGWAVSVLGAFTLGAVHTAQTSAGASTVTLTWTGVAAGDLILAIGCNGTGAPTVGTGTQIATQAGSGGTASHNATIAKNTGTGTVSVVFNVNSADSSAATGILLVASGGAATPPPPPPIISRRVTDLNISTPNQVIFRNPDRSLIVASRPTQITVQGARVTDQTIAWGVPNQVISRNPDMASIVASVPVIVVQGARTNSVDLGIGAYITKPTILRNPDMVSIVGSVPVVVVQGARPTDRTVAWGVPNQVISRNPDMASVVASIPTQITVLGARYVDLTPYYPGPVILRASLADPPIVIASAPPAIVIGARVLDLSVQAYAPNQVITRNPDMVSIVGSVPVIVVQGARITDASIGAYITRPIIFRNPDMASIVGSVPVIVVQGARAVDIGPQYPNVIVLRNPLVPPAPAVSGWKVRVGGVWVDTARYVRHGGIWIPV